MPLFKMLNGDLFSIDTSPISMSVAMYRLINEGVLTHEQYIKVIDSETEEELSEVDLLYDKLYLIYIDESFIVKWINVERLDWKTICRFDYAVPFLRAHPEYINWDELCCNPHPDAIQMIEEKIQSGTEVCLHKICKDPSIARLLKLYPGSYREIEEHSGVKVCWHKLCENPSAVRLLKLYPDKIDWIRVLRYNPNPEVLPLCLERIGEKKLANYMTENDIASFAHPDSVPFVKQFDGHINSYHVSLVQNPSPDVYPIIKSKFDWDDRSISTMLCYSRNTLVLDEIVSNHFRSICILNFNRNPCAIPYLKRYPKLIHWMWLSINPSKEAMEMIEEHLVEHPNEPLDWATLSKNPHAISIIEKHLVQVDWDLLSMNPNALRFIEAEPCKIYAMLSHNPAIFLSYKQE